MKRLLTLCAAATLLSACGATSNSVVQAATSFGLVGSWALDCSQPASANNPYSTYSVRPDGKLGLKEDNGAPDEFQNANFTDAQTANPDEIQLVGVFDSNNLNLQRTLHKNSQGQIRIWTESDGGTAMVMDGAISGRDTPWKTKCS